MMITQQVISGALVASGSNAVLYDWFLNKIPWFELTYAVDIVTIEEVQTNLGFI